LALSGITVLRVVGSTAAIGTIEFEPGLQHDLPDILDKLIPPSRNYGHDPTWHDGKGHSHLQATLLGPSLTVPISDGKLVLAISTFLPVGSEEPNNWQRKKWRTWLWMYSWKRVLSAFMEWPATR
jgi:uncharacterized protein UPF0047